MRQINLGDKVRDSVTGFKGIAVARTTWLHGCDRITIQPEGVDKSGKTYETQSFDEPQLILMTAKKISEGRRDTGGPRPEAFPKRMPQRF